MRRLALTLVALLVACGPTAAPARDPLAGSYRIGGGDSSIEIVKALTAAFTALHPGVQFDLNTSLGSDPAVKLAGDGTFDLGMASRDLTAEEASLVRTTVIGAAGTALAVNAQNLVRDLSSAQVASIFSGKLSDWSAVGGDKSAILPLIREKGSSARTTFENVIYAGKPTYHAGVLEIVGGDQMRQAISGQRSAIGMIGVTSDDPAATGVRIVRINGVMPTKATLRDGSYNLRRPLYLLASRSVEPKPAIASFLAFVGSTDGQKVLDRF